MIHFLYGLLIAFIFVNAINQVFLASEPLFPNEGLPQRAIKFFNVSQNTQTGFKSVLPFPIRAALSLYTTDVLNGIVPKVYDYHFVIYRSPVSH